MEETIGAQSLLDKIKPPRLEDAGLEDCALPSESIQEAFRKAASAVRSLVSASDDEDESGGGRCVEDPWEDSSDALVGIEEGLNAPLGGCAGEKGSGLTEAPGDKVSVVGGDQNEGKSDTLVEPGLPVVGPGCVDGLQGLEIGEKREGILGEKVGGDVAEDSDDEGEKKRKPTLTEDYV